MDKQARCENKIKHVIDQNKTISEMTELKPITGANGIEFKTPGDFFNFNLWRIQILKWAQETSEPELAEKLDELKVKIGEDWPNRSSLKLKGKGLGYISLIVEASLLEIALGGGN